MAEEEEGQPSVMASPPRRWGCSGAIRPGVLGGGDLRSASRGPILLRVFRLLGEGCEGGRVAWCLLGRPRLGRPRLGILQLGILQLGCEERRC
jgi:hypothetical protein